MSDLDTSFTDDVKTDAIGAVVIGRNEGPRLIACLQSLAETDARLVYVDSGSTDDSVSQARALGAYVVALDPTKPFTAARARNAGLAALGDGPAYVQFVDGDCEIRSGWIKTARAFLDANPTVAVVCGRRRERFPQASVYNQMCDQEWDTPIGQTKACGGDAMMRAEAVRSVDGFDDSLIAGEEPEMCVRLRAKGWHIWRLDHEMTWHDANMTRFAQWWRRSRRAGFAFAHGAALHGAPPERHWVLERRRALIWGLGLPVLICAMTVLVSLWCIVLLLIYPLQMARLARRMPWTMAGFTVLGKFAETVGVCEYQASKLFAKKSGIIEYK